MYKTRLAVSSDIARIVELGTAFHEESPLYRNATINWNWPALLVMWWEENKDFLTILVEDENEIAGYANVMKMGGPLDIVLDAIGEIHQYYISPNHRGKGASRVLNEAIDAQFDKWDCLIRHVECACGLDSDGSNDKLFSNMWKKRGYKLLGTNLFRAKFDDLG